MLPKNSRLPRKLFPELLKASRFVNSPAFSLRFSTEKAFDRPRVAVSVSKKISKSAVVRNRARRRVYSLIYPLLSRLSSGAYLFVAKSGVEKLKIDELKSEVEKLLKESKMFV
ncbi:MAG: ribonuclease P protein component [Minisyncoccota bacterium]